MGQHPPNTIKASMVFKTSKANKAGKAIKASKAMKQGYHIALSMLYIISLDEMKPRLF